MTPVGVGERAFNYAQRLPAHTSFIARLDRATQYAAPFEIQSQPSLQYWMLRLRGA
jgi:hypothetical protein